MILSEVSQSFCVPSLALQFLKCVMSLTSGWQSKLGLGVERTSCSVVSCVPTPISSGEEAGCVDTQWSVVLHSTLLVVNWRKDSVVLHLQPSNKCGGNSEFMDKRKLRKVLFQSFQLRMGNSFRFHGLVWVGSKLPGSTGRVLLVRLQEPSRSWQVLVSCQWLLSAPSLSRHSGLSSSASPDPSPSPDVPGLLEGRIPVGLCQALHCY